MDGRPYLYLLLQATTEQTGEGIYILLLGQSKEASALDHVHPYNRCSHLPGLLTDIGVSRLIINTTLIWHDRIPTVRTSGGPLYQKRGR